MTKSRGGDNFSGMTSKSKILAGGAVALLLIAIYVLSGRLNSSQLKLNPTPTPTVEQKIEQKFNVAIPDNLEKAILKDTEGGESEGIATRKYLTGKFNLTVLAALPDPESQNFYEVWIAKGKVADKDYQVIPVGKLRIAKGGWLVDFNSTKNYSDFNSVIISLEKKIAKAPEKIILEGSF